MKPWLDAADAAPAPAAPDGDADGLALADALAPGEGLGDADALAVGEALGDAVAEGDALADGAALALGAAADGAALGAADARHTRPGGPMWV